MARIRTIKPEFWTAEQVMELSRDARLLFIGLWNFCDDAGVHPASTKTLKAEVLPADDVTSASIRRMIDECIQNGLLIEYEVDGRSYWKVTGWHHQKIDRPTYKYPRPEGDAHDEKPIKSRHKQFSQPKNSTIDRRMFDECSTNDPRTLDERSTTEWSGVESNKNQNQNQNQTSSVVTLSTPQPESREPAPNNPTRKGALCKQLRSLGIEAAPHLLAWAELLAAYSDAEIVAAAELAREKKPGERLHLNYLLPILRDRRAPGTATANQTNRRRSIHDKRADTIAALTGRNRQPEESGRVIDITPTAASGLD